MDPKIDSLSFYGVWYGVRGSFLKENQMRKLLVLAAVLASVVPASADWFSRPSLRADEARLPPPPYWYGWGLAPPYYGDWNVYQPYYGTLFGDTSPEYMKRLDPRYVPALRDGGSGESGR